MNGISISELPRLRTLDFRSELHNGHPHIMLRDPLHLSDSTLLVPQPLAVVLSFCDGTRSAPEIATMFSSVYGVSIDTATVESLLDALDDALLLDNTRSREALAAARQRFRALEFRPPFLAGQSYPATAANLQAHFDNFLAQANGLNAPSETTQSKIGGLLSPHIDYHRGGETYAHVWSQAAAAARAADLVVIFATDHYGNDAFTLTRQNYATPYGILPTATDLVEKLASIFGEEEAYAGELRHISEHSIELVINWLHHMRNGEPCEVAPILCGSYRNFTSQPAQGSHTTPLRQTVELLREQAITRNILFVASGDMAHVGTAFGGKPLDADKRAQVKNADDKLISAMCAGDARAFLDEIIASSDAHNVCGVAPIYLTMRTLGNIRGEMTSYATCPADDTNTSAVTISGVVFRSLDDS